ncbi:YceI family protein [Oceanospirillum sediminis]|uniref:YceI family protein n=1 Tax=Oceanospirillum sediminis TaxID=2760088 RepID=A0A839IQ30_9GAMM|nr:YceI family protein [Oceanospirillum sediminis]MBB1486810.1 YceI family protein [Oceanospirillum sediminis]
MKKLLTALCLTSIASFAQADWQLNLSDSDFNFASIKKNNAYETHTFKEFRGSVDGSGKAVLTLNLASVATGIDIRDQRMKTMLFDTQKFPAAEYQLQVNAKQLDSMKAGERLQLEADGNLSLFGTDKKQTAALNIYKLSDQRLLVSTAHPMVINASDYGLDKGVEALREIAGLPVISLSVPVTFNLVFDKK